MIEIEDLAVADMARNRRLARAISDCDWGEFRRQLEYKCRRYGRQLAMIDRWHPSSSTCSACANLPAALCLSRPVLDVPVLRRPARPGTSTRRRTSLPWPGAAWCDACGADVRHSGCSRP